MGVSINGGTPSGWFIMEKKLLKWMIWGYPYFRKPPYIYTYIHTCPQHINMSPSNFGAQLAFVHGRNSLDGHVFQPFGQAACQYIFMMKTSSNLEAHGSRSAGKVMRGSPVVTLGFTQY
jgi:hypothetical protein